MAAAASMYRPRDSNHGHGHGYGSSHDSPQHMGSRRAAMPAPSGSRAYADSSHYAQPPRVASLARPPSYQPRSSYGASSSAGSYKIEIDRAHPEREVIVIGDSPTPPPSSSSHRPPPHRRDLEAQAGEPSSKKRRANDGAVAASHAIPRFTADMPYGNGMPSPAGPHASSSGVGTKRKLGDEYAASRQPVAKAARKEPPARKSPPPLPCDDKDGHFIPRAGETLGDPKRNQSKRYTIVRLLGQGTFGKVVEAMDSLAPDPSKRRVAIKVIRAVQKYRDASRVEIKVLKLLSQRDPTNEKQCIHMREYFDDRNHICLVTDLLGPSVFDYLKDNDYQPFPMCHIQSFARQLLRSVEFLHENELVHTDLKPENILLGDASFVLRPVKGRTQARNQPVKMTKILKRSDIHLIDFGSATFEHEYHATVVSTRHYRAPEIILGMGWSYPCDVWSIGCILVELLTGEALFQTHENLEHLAMMDMVFGRMPEPLVREGVRNKSDWFRAGRLDFPNAQTSRQSKKFVKAMKPLHEIVPETTIAMTRFQDLLRRLLAWDPHHTVKQALQHSFLALDLSGEERQLLNAH